jgi:nuclear protein localization family protein 4
MIVRIQSSEGTKRINLQPEDTLEILLIKIKDVFTLTSDQTLYVYRSPGYQDALTSGYINMPLKAIPIRHGDMLYILVKDSMGKALEESQETEKRLMITEDTIDSFLRKKDGKIYRPRDPQLCHHGPQGKCLNCAPLEPWDSKYMASQDPPIKHMSFHCYLRMLTSGVDKGKFVNLESISCKIKSNCNGHPPWPDGICTKCQPSAITLARQVYRHVDNIMFEDKNIVDRFLEGWRRSGGLQRVGFLYGRYEEYEKVSLGIKAVVAAIYEPPQVTILFIE